MEKTERKSLIIQSLKSGLISFVLSCIFVLVLALIAKLFTLSGSVLPIVNQVLKVAAVAAGTLIAVKDDKFLLKGILGAVIFSVLTFVLFLILGGQFKWGQVALDLVIAVAVAAVVSLIKSRKK